MSDNSYLVKKALVRLSIEKVLIDKGKGVYDIVSHELFSRYRCRFQDCYDHPEYLNEVLKKLYSKDHKAIAESIRIQLKEFSYYDSIARFLDEISK